MFYLTFQGWVLFILALKIKHMIFSKITWNPPIGIDLGFFTIHFYSLMWIVAFLLGFQIMKRIYANENQKLEHLDSMFMYAIVGTMLGARLGHVFFYDWGYFKDNLFEILLPVKFSPKFQFTGFRGLASHGAAIAFIIAMYYFSKKIIKKPLFWSLDRAAISASFGGIFIRLGNFINAEIIGNVTDASTGVKFIRAEVPEYQAMKLTGLKNANKAYAELTSNPKFSGFVETLAYRHPAQAYEAFGYLIVSMILLWLYWKTDKKNNPGFIFGMYMALTFTVRLIVENVKKSQGGFEETLGLLSTGQWLSIPFIAVGIYFIWKSLQQKTI